MRGNDETNFRLWYSTGLEDLFERDAPASCDQEDSGRCAAQHELRFPRCPLESRSSVGGTGASAEGSAAADAFT